jgi:hypothetical protein
MPVPGFTAEATLSRVGDRHYAGRAADGMPPSQGIVPQNIACDIYIFCVDGERYMKLDCPDGSGDTYEIGVCPRPFAKKYAYIWTHRPWLTARG